MSEVKVNKISPRTACGTVTLGDSGDTFTIPSGATITNAGTASGFGATGAVSWDTSSIKTAGFTATTGIGYFCNTTGGIFTVTLPSSPSAGDVVGVSDYAKTWDTGNLTLGRNGSNIGGGADDAILATEGLAVTLVYVDGTKGWIVTDSGLQSDAPGPLFVTATGGTPCSGAIDGDYKVHSFTGPGALCISCAGNAAGSNTVDYLVIAGGGGAGHGDGTTDEKGGGGGGGGYLASYPNPATGGHPVTATPYGITVGGGGTGGPVTAVIATQGASSIFSTITSAGGGRGGQNHPTAFIGGDGGSGGGGSGGGPNAGGSGNTPPVSSPSNPVQGFDAGNGVADDAAPGFSAGGGGGGGSAVGANGTPSCGGNGGAGFTSCITGSPVGRGGGGAGSAGGAGGTATNGGGGGAGCSPSTSAVAGTVNTGGGGGAGGTNAGAGAGAGGGSGIVVIRYKFQ